MSIVDRITALFNRPNFLNSPKAKFNQMYQVYAFHYGMKNRICIYFSIFQQEKHPSVDAMLDNDSLCQTRLSITSPKINVKLRSANCFQID